MEHEKHVIDRESMGSLFDALVKRGYRVVGPTVRDGAIIYDDIMTPEDLPVGWTDEQDAGKYRLKQREDQALFGYVVGPHSWKKFLHPPTMRLWQAERRGKGFSILEEPEDIEKFAFIGVRSCELHAIAIQDKVFIQESYVDRTYKQRREKSFIVAVNCGQAGGTCFCTSMKTGPKATFGYDLALTELMDVNRHVFVVSVGTELGAEVLRDISYRRAETTETEQSERIVQHTAESMGRSMDNTDIKALLYGHSEHPRWDEIAQRCLSCANCTMSCPTCFCTTVEDVTDLTGEHAERWRTWDSCFTMDFSYVFGGTVRASTKARYRQWMTHKLATWFDQFGSSGCVGCGRCITWCPVGIDITEEVTAIRESTDENQCE